MTQILHTVSLCTWQISAWRNSLLDH
ncbi:hypothetical protein E2C01_009617 [Portunus trituberculatus]|uniref:Uncharacterized protein n=1 Tax=Portunus trituberculatus TaxID=210409 RepID=A0A5B7D688_PORTR|nr:hypothetical protein [Portunus trituberculatus]